MNTSCCSSNTSTRNMGQVKWFNNKAGYGFITMTGVNGVETDIFTHYSTVHVKDTQYKFLVQGEYVEFDLVDSTSENHKYQATNVTGMRGGKLMCETRQSNRTNVHPSSRVAAPPATEGEFQNVMSKRQKQLRK